MKEPETVVCPKCGQVTEIVTKNDDQVYSVCPVHGLIAVVIQQGEKPEVVQLKAVRLRV